MKRVLVVVDYQKDFVDGALGFEKAKEIEEGIYEKVNSYLSKGDKVVFTYDTHTEDYLATREGKNLPVTHCILNHINKGSFGISPSKIIELSEKLGENINCIEIIGVVTNICVISNVVMFQSQYTNAEILVDAKLCAGFNEELHEKAFDVMEGIQVKVINRK